MDGGHPVAEHVPNAEDMLVLLAPGVSPLALSSWGLPDTAEIRQLESPVGRPRDRRTVLVAARDLVDLRRAATALANVGAATQVGVCFEREVDVLPSVAPRPEWPSPEGVVACRRGQSHVVVTFPTPVPARPVLLEIARASAANRSPAAAWPLLGTRRDEAWLWPPGDAAATVAMPMRLFDTTVDSPPDLIITHDTAETPGTFEQEPHAVLGRAPTVVGIRAPLSWDDLEGLSHEALEAELTSQGTLSVGAIDERLLNPIGFDRGPTGSPSLLDHDEGPVLTAKPAGPGTPLKLDGDRGLSETDVPQLRQLPGLELGWRGCRGPQHYCRLVASLAMTGVPMTSSRTPQWARHLLPQEVVDALEQRVDLNDRLEREEHSIRLRRAALRNYATDPWRRAMARSQGLQESAPPRVSILLVTRRPDMLPFALRQVARQRDVDFELIIATHGFEPDPALFESFRERCLAPLTAFSVDPAILFGEVMNLAAERAVGDVLLKMDDDDWYAPDFVADLLLAREYSGADVVGCPPEFTFVEPLWLTTRRPDETEAFRAFVAGGTMLIDRSAFRALGGFRHTRKYVDANLLSAVTSAGGSVYRTHGLGYVLRRGSSGHTWDPGLGYFVTQKRAPEQWRGFRPSRLLEVSSADLPARTRDERAVP